MSCLKTRTLLLLTLAAGTLSAQADVSVSAMFGDHMVFQREQANPVWGKADPGEKIAVSINGQTKTTEADADGDWMVKIDALPTGGPYELTIKGNNTLTFTDVLSGEVWVCSGQSNMQWPLERTDFAELELASANYPQIRLMTVNSPATQKPQFTFNNEWQVCTPESVKSFSAVGYLFGKRLYNTLHVPVGLIDNAWGGSALEAWLPREKFDVDEFHTQFLKNYDEKVANYTDENRKQDLAKWEDETAEWKANGSKGRAPRKPSDPRYNQHRPANLYNGRIAPILGYGIRGVIWYQGETNGSRGYQYRTSFPLMIETWRDAWGQGDFPFYWVQLADYKDESDEPGSSGWAELREAQTLTLSLPNTGQAVIVDVGEGRDIHPRNKQVVANRLALLALTKDYGYDFAAESPLYDSMEVKGNKVVLTFDNIDQGLYTFDVNEPIGFAIAGEDQKFVWADAKITGKDTIEVWSKDVPNPVAVRYAWANNPVCNVQDRNGLPLTPFRTDDWKITSQK
ncbi:sialate O-acetylesterase [Ruficoccus sp. ZRK36]|uniref:sialate O-acetylesterase n=1 Tax=Ruficoccus sp. ZRK36 TaxID=2866311 RepID=UPI001C73786B|nr:sialate O-acetylesterase [Ruficoccus sp. ZRK36]QYY37154.1 sialate O-acetylesterase [Ruficoccus sp. ZRK36]